MAFIFAAICGYGFGNEGPESWWDTDTADGCSVRRTAEHGNANAKSGTNHHALWKLAVTLIDADVGMQAKNLSAIESCSPQFTGYSPIPLWRSACQQVLINTEALARCITVLRCFSRLNGFSQLPTKC
jgi:hypothetical protein